MFKPFRHILYLNDFLENILPFTWNEMLIVNAI